MRFQTSEHLQASWETSCRRS